MKRYITAFLLIISVGILYLSTLITNTLLSEEYILNKAEQANYYQKLYETIYESFSNYTMQSGLEEQVVQDTITIDKIKTDTNIILDNFYKGANTNIETDSIKEKLSQNINNYLKDNNLNIQDESSLETFKGLIIQQYKNNINEHSNQDEKIYNIIVKAKNILNKAKGISIIAIIITLILFFIFNKKNLIKIVSVLGIVSTFFGIIFLFVNSTINSIIDIQNIYILNESISELAKLVISENLLKFIVQGIILLILGLFLIFIGNYKESTKKLENK